MELSEQITSFETEISRDPQKSQRLERLKTVFYAIKGPTEEEKLNYFEDLKKLHFNDTENNSFSNTEIDKRLQDLIKDLKYEETVLRKNTVFQYFFAIWEIPIAVLIIILFFSLISINILNVDFSIFLFISVGILIATVIHSFFILRIHQQYITAIEKLLEKRLGTQYLEVAEKNPNLKELMMFGIKMFLTHHVKPAEPINSGDNPITINVRKRGKSDNE